MTPLINLLPWRKTLRQRRVRRWSTLFCSILLFMPLLVASMQQLSAWQIQQLQGHKKHLASTQTALQHLSQQRLALQEQSKKWRLIQQAREARKHAIQIWETRLIQLATFKPVGAWFSSLSLQKGQFLIKGHATDMEDIQRLEKELAQLDGVSVVRAGAVQHETQGGYGFVFTLTLTEVANALDN
jgi:pilus assembly protein HofN